MSNISSVTTLTEILFLDLKVNTRFGTDQAASLSPVKLGLARVLLVKTDATGGSRRHVMMEYRVEHWTSSETKGPALMPSITLFRPKMRRLHWLMNSARPAMWAWDNQLVRERPWYVWKFDKLIDSRIQEPEDFENEFFQAITTKAHLGDISQAESYLEWTLYSWI